MSNEHAERLERLKADVESKESVLRDALAFLMDDRNLTVEGIAARERLLREIAEIERDTEAVKQEHRLD